MDALGGLGGRRRSESKENVESTTSKYENRKGQITTIHLVMIFCLCLLLSSELCLGSEAFRSSRNFGLGQLGILRGGSEHELDIVAVIHGV